MTADEFGEREGVSARLVMWWNWRLREAEREGELPFREEEVADPEDEEASKGAGPPAPSGFQVDADGTLPRFLQVRLRQEALPSAVGIAASEPLGIHLANGRVVLARPDPSFEGYVQGDGHAGYKKEVGSPGHELVLLRSRVHSIVQFGTAGALGGQAPGELREGKLSRPPG